MILLFNLPIIPRPPVIPLDGNAMSSATNRTRTFKPSHLALSAAIPKFNLDKGDIKTQHHVMLI